MSTRLPLGGATWGSAGASGAQWAAELGTHAGLPQEGGGHRGPDTCRGVRVFWGAELVAEAPPGRPFLLQVGR